MLSCPASLQCITPLLEANRYWPLILHAGTAVRREGVSHLESAQLSEDVHDGLVAVVLGDAGSIVAHFIHDAQHARLARILLEILILM